VDDVHFKLEISGTAEDLPIGFLFLCPVEDFRTGPSSVRWPECPAYWSLDPFGVEQLSKEEATCLGFPSIKQITKIPGLYWDASVYDGLHQFPQAKGFDPESQDLAQICFWKLDYPLNS